MISVKKNFNDIPEVLRSADPNSDAWNDISVISKLKELYHSKCAYCETKTNDLVINHYRPKSKYPWLKNEWSNLLPACIKCNENKGERFPINGIQVTDKNGDHKANSKKYLDEKPLILNPEIDTPENHLFFMFSGQIKGRSEREEGMITILDLNRIELINSRLYVFNIFLIKELSIICGFQFGDFDFFAHNDGKKIETLTKFIIKFYETFDYVRYNNKLRSVFISLYSKTKDSEAFSSFVKSSMSSFFEHLRKIDNLVDILLEFALDYQAREKIYSKVGDKNENINDCFRHSIREAKKHFYCGEEQKYTIQYPYFNYIYIQKYQAIDFIKIEKLPPTQWIFLTGENAKGKTSLLEAINFGIYLGKHVDISELERLNYTLIKAGIHFFGEIHTYQNHYKESFLPVNIPIFYKGENVMNIETDLDSALIKWSLFEEDFDKKAKLIEVIKNLIPDLEKIEVVPATQSESMVLYYEKNQNNEVFSPVVFKDLATGIKSIIGFITDMIFKLGGVEFYEMIGKDFRNISGIAIIDEFDNHLHPKWQRMLVEKLTKLFPKVQFIVSTHSPIPFLGAPKNSVFIKVDRTKENGITAEVLDIDVSTLTPNSILTSPVFGFDDINSTEIDIEDVATADRYSNVEQEKRLKEKLNILKLNDEEFFNSLMVK